MTVVTVSRLERVAFNHQLEERLCIKDGNDIQQYSSPLLQELLMPDSPGLGRAATKTAMKAAKKRASLENIVKVKVGCVCK